MSSSVSHCPGRMLPWTYVALDICCPGRRLLRSSTRWLGRQAEDVAGEGFGDLNAGTPKSKTGASTSV